MTKQRRPAAPARPRHLLRAALHRHRPRTARQDRRGAQGMNRNASKRLAPWLFTIACSSIWEAACRIFNGRRLHPAGAVGGVRRRWCSTGSRCCAIRCVTLWTTMAGFALAVAFGIVLGLVVGWSRTIYRGLYPVMIGFNSHPQGGGGADPGHVVRHRRGAGDPDRLPDLVLPDRRQRRHRARHHGAGARGRAARARRQQARHHAQGRHPAQRSPICSAR